MAIREKAPGLDFEDFRLVVLAFFHGLQYDTGKQFVILNGFITPAMAKKRKVEATGEDNGRAHAEYFEGLVNKASPQQLGAWLVQLALIGHLDHSPYYYGDGPKPDPRFDTALRWGLDGNAIKDIVSEQSKPNRTKQKRGTNRRRNAGRRPQFLPVPT